MSHSDEHGHQHTHANRQKRASLGDTMRSLFLDGVTLPSPPSLPPAAPIDSRRLLRLEMTDRPTDRRYSHSFIYVCITDDCCVFVYVVCVCRCRQSRLISVQLCGAREFTYWIVLWGWGCHRLLTSIPLFLPRSVRACLPACLASRRHFCGAVFSTHFHARTLFHYNSSDKN